MKTIGCGLALLLFVSSGARVRADDAAQKTIAKSFAVTPGGNLEVDADQGDLDILAGEQRTVEILVEREIKNGDEAQAAKAFARHKVTFSHDGNTVRVQANLPKASPTLWSSAPPKLHVHLRITLPRRFNVTLTTSEGNIQVSDLNGTVDAGTSGGDLIFNKIRGAIDAHTAGGNIKATGCSEKLTLQTSGGNVFIKDFGDADSKSSSATGIQVDSLGGNVEAVHGAGKLQLKTSGGNIVIEEFSGPSAFADTAGGSLSIGLTGQTAGDSYFRTSGGNITARLPATIAVNLLASTGGGTINSALPVTLKGKPQAERLEGKINGGGPVFSLKTSGGDIQLLAQ